METTTKNLIKVSAVSAALAALTVSAAVIAVMVATQPVTHVYTFQGETYRIPACDVDRLGQTTDYDCFRIAGVTDNGPGHDYVVLDGVRVYGATQLDM